MSGFKSSNYVFRQTALGQALNSVGLGNGSMVRDPIFECLSKDRHDRHGIRPSQVQILDRNVHTPGAFGREKVDHIKAMRKEWEEERCGQSVKS